MLILLKASISFSFFFLILFFFYSFKAVKFLWITILRIQKTNSDILILFPLYNLFYLIIQEKRENSTTTTTTTKGEKNVYFNYSSFENALDEFKSCWPLELNPPFISKSRRRGRSSF